MPLSAPTLPIYSTLTGNLLTAAEATDPNYWARHLREAVRFSPAVRSVLAEVQHASFIEVGPRNTLTTLVRQHATKSFPAPAVALLGDQPATECAAWRLAAGRLWASGIEIDLFQLDERARKLRVRLPTYPFERKRFWVDIAGQAPAIAASIPPAAPVLAASVSPLTPEPTMTSGRTPASTPAAAPAYAAPR